MNIRNALLRTSSLWLPVALVAMVACSVFLQAQTSETTSSSDQNSAINPSRVTVQKTEQNGRTIETQVVEGPSVNGGYAPLVETEQETTQLNPNTTTVVTRHYVRDANGKRQLVNVTEERRSTAGGGRETVERTTSNADANGGLQVIQREVQETVPTGNDASQTTSTTFRQTGNGFQPVQRSQMTEQRKGDVTEQQTTTLATDGNGNFVPVSRAESTIKKTASGQTKDQRIYKDTGVGKESMVQREVTTETKDAQGTHSTTQTYSAFVPGATPDPGHLVLNQEVSGSQQTAPDGTVQSTQHTNAINLGNPSAGLQPATSVTSLSQPAGKGEKKTQTTVRGSDGNGGFGAVRVTDSHETKVVP
jgi:hypothetical protein